jgi:hypothetical protein
VFTHIDFVIDPWFAFALRRRCYLFLFGWLLVATARDERKELERGSEKNKFV